MRVLLLISMHIAHWHQQQETNYMISAERCDRVSKESKKAHFRGQFNEEQQKKCTLYMWLILCWYHRDGIVTYVIIFDKLLWKA